MTPIKLAVLGIFVAGVAASLAPARADTIKVAFNLNSLPSAPGTITPLTLSTADLGLTSFTFGSGTGLATVTTDVSAGQGVVQGTVSGLHADPATGPSTFYTAPYFSTGIGSIDIKFADDQSFLGLIWGSIDATNEITFKLAGVTVGTFTGADMGIAASVNPSGSQGYGGSFYTLLNDTDGSFNEIVLSSGVVSFESADFESSPANTSAPEPAALALLGSGLLGIGLVRRRR